MNTIKNMQNVDRSGFETQWQAAFRGAEAQPKRDVWMAIENSLSRVENQNNKRRVVVYRRIAAALALCLVASVSLTVFKWNRSESDSSIVSQKVVEGKKSEPTDQLNVEAKGSSSTANASHTAAVTGANSHTSKVPSKKSETQSPSVAMTTTPTVAVDSATNNATSNLADRAMTEVQPGDNSAAIAHEPPKQLTEEEEKALVKKLLAEPEIVVEKKEPGRLWASVGAAAGSYMGDGGAGGAVPFGLSGNPSPSNPYSSGQQPTEGNAYSIGVLVGKQFGNRIQLQAGLTYMNQRADYTSNVVSLLDSRVALDQSAGINGASGYGVTSSYTVNSSTNYLSIPLQAGYLIVDRKVGLAVNAGLATDLFLTNTLSDASGQRQSSTQQAGDQGLYRAVSFAGIGNMEFNFRLANHYQLSLVPGFRYSLTNVYQEGSFVNKPLVFDVGFRFRYIFR